MLIPSNHRINETHLGQLKYFQRLWTAPISNPTRVLDCGTGTGIWAFVSPIITTWTALTIALCSSLSWRTGRWSRYSNGSTIQQGWNSIKLFLWTRRSRSRFTHAKAEIWPDLLEVKYHPPSFLVVSDHQIHVYFHSQFSQIYQAAQEDISAFWMDRNRRRSLCHSSCSCKEFLCLGKVEAVSRNSNEAEWVSNTWLNLHSSSYFTRMDPEIALQLEPLLESAGLVNVQKRIMRIWVKTRGR